MKTLVIDARMVGPIGHGISKYVEGIADNLKDENAVTRQLLSLLQVSSVSSINVIFLIRPECPKDSPIRRFSCHEVDLSCFNPLSWFKVPSVLKKLGADLFLNPTFASFLWLPCEYVQTVHDLNHLSFGGITHKVYYWMLLKRSIYNAKEIFTVSEFVKREISNWSRIDQKKIYVDYNRIDPPARRSPDIVAAVLKRFNVKSKAFFLSVSNPKPHKNLLTLFEAYADYRVLAKEATFPLLVTISPNDLRKPSEGVVLMGGVSNEELDVLYCHAKAFFYPSLYEGFGRPPIEAALVGTEVFASDIPPHREGRELFNLPIHLLNPNDKKLWTKAFSDATMN